MLHVLFLKDSNCNVDAVPCLALQNSKWGNVWDRTKKESHKKNHLYHSSYLNSKFLMKESSYITTKTLHMKSFASVPYIIPFEGLQ